jgi:hypothetical protein
MEKTYVRVKMEDMRIVEKLKAGEKIYILRKNVFPSEDLIQTNNPLWGFYDVLSFMIDGEEIYTKDLFQYEWIVCGDCDMGECIIKNLEQNYQK